MMSKFLLLFCFTTLHVLGQKQGVSPIKNDHLPVTVISEQSGTAQNSDAKVLPNSIVKSEDPVLLGNIENEEKLDENATTTQNTSSNASHTMVVPPNSTTVPLVHPVTMTTTVKPVDSTTVDTTTVKPVDTTTDNTVVTTPSLPPASPAKWIVNGTDKICIVVQMSAEFNVTYEKANHTTSYKVFDMPVDNATTKATGNCGQFEQVLTLTWSSNNDTNGNMSLHFVRNETAKDYFIHHLEVVLPRTDFPNTTLNESMILTHKASNYVAGLTNSYRCMMKQKLNLKQNGTNETTGYIILSTLQFQAFKTDNSTTFGLAKDCAFKTSDVVPIAVGCALAGLVIAVLITYLIGRRRNQSRGYLSM